MAARTMRPMSTLMTYRLLKTPSAVCLALILLKGSWLAAAEPAPSDASRTELAAQIYRNIEAGTIAMAEATEQSKLLDENAQAEFKLITGFVHTAEKRLRRSLTRVSTASADDWPRARRALAVDYDAYTEAIGQAERLVATAMGYPHETHAR